MQTLFTSEEKIKAFRTKSILLAVYICVSVILWGANAAVLTCFILRYITKGLGMFINILITALWGMSTLFFFGLQFPVVNKFCRMLMNMKNGLKDEVTLRFLSFDETPVTKDGVEFYTMKMFVKPDKLGLIEGERNVLIEKGRIKPPVVEGDIIKIRTHANILIEYEIMPRADKNKEQ